MQQQGFAAAVKKIVDVKIAKDGSKYFRICWKDTWEPEAHLLSCQTLLDDFLEKRNFQQKTENNTDTSNRSQKIQCDLINTTTNKLTSPDEGIKQLSCNNAVEQNQSHPTTTCQITSEKYHSCCSQRTFESQRIAKSDSIIQCSLCHCFDSADDESVSMRDVGCQCEPDVRHFAVQKQETKEEKPEVAEVSIQVEPTVCCTSTQYFDPLKQVQRICYEIETFKKDQQQLPKIQADMTTAKVDPDQEYTSDNQVLNTEEVVSDNMQSPNLIELDYSQIPSEILQQILQNTSPEMHILQQQQKITEGDGDKSDSLKPMFFVVDGNTQPLFEQDKLASLIQNQKVANAVNSSTKTKPMRGRKRKSEVDSIQERSTKQHLSKAVHSRNLFQCDNDNVPNAMNIVTLPNINQTLIVPLTVSANVCQALGSPVATIVNSPDATPLNESNVSIVSTVYDPSTPSLNVEAKTNLHDTNTVKLVEKTLATEKKLSSFTTDEEKINEDFISKYWK